MFHLICIKYSIWYTQHLYQNLEKASSMMLHMLLYAYISVDDMQHRILSYSVFRYTISICTRVLIFNGKYRLTCTLHPAEVWVVHNGCSGPSSTVKLLLKMCSCCRDEQRSWLVFAAVVEAPVVQLLLRELWLSSAQLLSRPQETAATNRGLVSSAQLLSRPQEYSCF